MAERTEDDLRTRAREAAKKRGQPRHWTAYENGYIDGFHAAQQPSREQIARALHDDDLSGLRCLAGDERDCMEVYLRNADAILALFDGADLSSRVERNLDDLDHAEANSDIWRERWRQLMRDHEDVPWLLAEVERLRRGRNIWRDQADRAEATLARVEAAIRLVSPDHITPQGARIIRAALAEETK